METLNRGEHEAGRVEREPVNPEVEATEEALRRIEEAASAEAASAEAKVGGIETRDDLPLSDTDRQHLEEAKTKIEAKKAGFLSRVGSIFKRKNLDKIAAGIDAGPVHTATAPADIKQAESAWFEEQPAEYTAEQKAAARQTAAAEEKTEAAQAAAKKAELKNNYFSRALTGTRAEVRATLDTLWDQLSKQHTIRKYAPKYEARPPGLKLTDVEKTLADVATPREKKQNKLYRAVYKKGEERLSTEQFAELQEDRAEESLTDAAYEQMKAGEIPWTMNAVFRATAELDSGKFIPIEEEKPSNTSSVGTAVEVAAAAGAVGLGVAAVEHDEPYGEYGLEINTKLAVKNQFDKLVASYKDVLGQTGANLADAERALKADIAAYKDNFVEKACAGLSAPEQQALRASLISEGEKQEHIAKLEAVLVDIQEAASLEYIDNQIKFLENEIGEETKKLTQLARDAEVMGEVGADPKTRTAELENMLAIFAEFDQMDLFHRFIDGVSDSPDRLLTNEQYTAKLEQQLQGMDDTAKAAFLENELATAKKAIARQIEQTKANIKNDQETILTRQADIEKTKRNAELARAKALFSSLPGEPPPNPDEVSMEGVAEEEPPSPDEVVATDYIEGDERAPEAAAAAKAAMAAADKIFVQRQKDILADLPSYKERLQNVLRGVNKTTEPEAIAEALIDGGYLTKEQADALNEEELNVLKQQLKNDTEYLLKVGRGEIPPPAEPRTAAETMTRLGDKLFALQESRIKNIDTIALTDIEAAIAAVESTKNAKQMRDQLAADPTAFGLDGRDNISKLSDAQLEEFHGRFLDYLEAQRDIKKDRLAKTEEKMTAAEVTKERERTEKVNAAFQNAKRFLEQLLTDDNIQKRIEENQKIIEADHFQGLASDFEEQEYDNGMLINKTETRKMIAEELQMDEETKNSFTEDDWKRLVYEYAKNWQEVISKMRADENKQAAPKPEPMIASPKEKTKAAEPKPPESAEEKAMKKERTKMKTDINREMGTRIDVKDLARLSAADYAKVVAVYDGFKKEKDDKKPGEMGLKLMKAEWAKKMQAKLLELK